MFCKNCGSMIPDDAKFCGNCGGAVSQPPGDTGVSSYMPEQKGEGRSTKRPAFGVKALVIAAGAAAVLLLVAAAVIAVINSGGGEAVSRGETPRGEAYRGEDIREKDTIENLYGTWEDDGQTLTLTFEKNGTLRVADANNIIGADVLKYRESDDNMLSLSANQDGLLGMISISMKYEFLGDRLLVEIAGQEFSLTRK